MTGTGFALNVIWALDGRPGGGNTFAFLTSTVIFFWFAGLGPVGAATVIFFWFAGLGPSGAATFAFVRPGGGPFGGLISIHA